jgi:hypothetical protein
MKMKKRLIYNMLVFGLGCLIVSVIYPLAKADAFVQRGYGALGGEVFLWLMPFAAVIATDTLIKWRRS